MQMSDGYRASDVQQLYIQKSILDSKPQHALQQKHRTSFEYEMDFHISLTGTTLNSLFNKLFNNFFELIQYSAFQQTDVVFQISVIIMWFVVFFSKRYNSVYIYQQI